MTPAGATDTGTAGPTDSSGASTAETAGVTTGAAAGESTAGGRDTPGAAPGSPPSKQPTADTPSCSSRLGGFLAQLDHLRRSLVIGVSYEQYVAELGTVRRSYAKVPVDSLSFSCLSGPATAAEESFDGYLAAANVWGDCVSEAGCETAALEPRLQREWRDAARHLRKAQRSAHKEVRS